MEREDKYLFIYNYDVNTLVNKNYDINTMISIQQWLISFDNLLGTKSDFLFFLEGFLHAQVTKVMDQTIGN